MARVDAAEKEASEVLHSLLSVERIVKPEHQDHDASAVTYQTNPQDASIQWHGPVSLFSTLDGNNQFQQAIDDQQVVVFTPIQHIKEYMNFI